VGTKFNKEDLIREVKGNYDRRIKEYEDRVTAEKAVTYEERMSKWREEQRARVLDLAGRIESVGDLELSRFSIKSPPETHRLYYTEREAESAIRSLVATRDKTTAYVSALAANADGVVELAAADLRRIGYNA
jgi:hypothetical protein